jgi:hypothetical protein
VHVVLHVLPPFPPFAMFSDLPPFKIHTFKNSPLLKNTFQEYVDATRLRQLINVGYNEPYAETFKQETGNEFEDVRAHLQDLFDNAASGELFVNYRKPKRNKLDNGRVFAEKSRSLFCLPKDIRGYLMKGNGIEHDISNCHASLLYDEAKAGKLNTPTLNRYVENRVHTLEHIQNAYNVDRETAKTLPLVLLYGGTFERWAEENNVTIPEDSPKTASCLPKNFARDLETICQQVRHANKSLWESLRSRIAKENRQRKAEGKPKKNARGCLLALYAQNLERRVLEHVFSKMHDEQRDGFVYGFDGFITRRTIETDVLNKWARQLFPSCTWSHKPFTGDKIREHVDKHPDKNKEHKLDNVEITDEQKRQFNLDLFKSFKTYDKKKEYFECFCAKVRMGEYWMTQEFCEFQNGVWVKALKHNKFTTFTLVESFGDLSAGLVPSKTGKRNAAGDILVGEAGSTKDFPRPDKFIERWTRHDENKRSFNAVDFCPSPVPYEDVTHTHDTLNSFLGYPRFLFDTSIKPKKRHETLLVIWRDILQNLVGGTLNPEETAQTLHAVECFFAHSIFNPAKRLQHGIVIQSQEGEGKGTICETLGSLVGIEHYFSTSNVADLFGTHSEQMENRLFLNLDEVDFNATKDKQGRLKALVTAPRWTINAKNVRPYDINVFASVIITTNNKFSIALDVSKGERRWWVLCGTGKYAGKRMPRHKWAVLHSEKGFKSKEFLCVLFKHLQRVYKENAEFDFNTFKFQNSRRTPYRELALNVVPDIAFYLQHFLESARFAYAGEAYDAQGRVNFDRIRNKHFEHLVPSYMPENHPSFEQMDEFNKPLLFCGSCLVRDFRAWGEANHYSYSSTRNEKSFYRMLQDLCLPVRKTTHNNAVYLEMTMRDIYQTLYTKNFIEIDPKTTWVKSGTEPEGDPSEDVCDWSGLCV